MSFLDQIFDARANPVSTNSRNSYRRNLVKLNGGEPVTSYDFLTDPKKIMKSIEHLSPNTQKSYVIAISSILKNSGLEELYNAYFQIMTGLNSRLSVNTVKSESQKANWISQEGIKALRESMRKALPKTRAISKGDQNKVLDYLVICLYTLTAPRRNLDYSLMKCSSDMSDKNFNYLDMPNSRFIFYNYKTAGTYHAVEVSIEPDLMAVLKLYLKSHPFSSKLKNKTFSFFLLLKDGEPLKSSADMTRILNGIFGKQVGASLLRNIYLTSKYGKIVNDLTEDVKIMGTSVNVALGTYIKTS